jgi:hypothetical protein
VEELLKVGVRILNAISIDRLIGTFHDWIKRFKVYIDSNGDYVE